MIYGLDYVGFCWGMLCFTCFVLSFGILWFWWFSVLVFMFVVSGFTLFGVCDFEFAVFVVRCVCA